MITMLTVPVFAADSLSEDDLEYGDTIEENNGGKVKACTPGRVVFMVVLFLLAALTFIFGRSFGFLFIMSVFLSWGISIANTCLG
jgi:hypothetical protein